MGYMSRQSVNEEVAHAGRYTTLHTSTFLVNDAGRKEPAQDG